MTSEYLAPTILSSRRLFGPNLFSDVAGAVLDVACHSDSDAARRAVTLWPVHAARLALALGWTASTTVVKRAHDSASLFLSAPIDCLLTASDLTEHAWVAAEAEAARMPMPEDPLPRMREACVREQSARRGVVPMQAYADQHALVFSLDDEGCSVGVGAGVRMLRHADTTGATRAVSEQAWIGAQDRPTVLVTGSNGKTTTTRLIAAMARAAGHRTGWSCSDGVWIDGQQVESGDYTGPGGARRVVCDAAVDCAVLETARGGMLRRGLAVDRVHAAVITNISADHFGEYGVETLDDLAQAKAIVARALRVGVPLALNADDPTLRLLADTLSVKVAWFSVGDGETLVADGVRKTGIGTRVREGRLEVHTGGAWCDLGAVEDMPITLHGTARHNVANAAAAALVAAILQFPVAAIRQVLDAFGRQSSDNPGRLMVRTLGDVTLVMDYAHNPDGMAALCRTAAALPAVRRLLLLGQAGNRDNAQLQALARSAWETQRFDRVIIKEMADMLRGREPGEVSAVLRDGLLEAGTPAEVISTASSELDGVREALVWARAGDVLVLGVHVSRRDVLQLVDTMEANAWRAGDALPAVHPVAEAVRATSP